MDAINGSFFIFFIDNSLFYINTITFDTKALQRCHIGREQLECLSVGRGMKFRLV